MAGISLIASGFLRELSVTYTQSAGEDTHTSPRKHHYLNSYTNTHIFRYREKTQWLLSGDVSGCRVIRARQNLPSFFYALWEKMCLNMLNC